MKHATAVEISDNHKTGPCSATYVSQRSCPPDCPLLGAGCYAEYGPLGIVTRRVEGGQATPLQIAREEAILVRKLTGERPLRLHVVGDCRTDAAVKELAAACEEYADRCGQPVWTYTHAWRRVKRASWGGVSVLASCERPEQVLRARRRGYAAALVVAEFVSDKSYVRDGLKLLPCPAQTRERTCVECRLCFDVKRLYEKDMVIAFRAHGSGRRRALTLLEG